MSESQNPGPDSSPNASPNASLDELVRRIKAFTDQVTVARPQNPQDGRSQSHAEPEPTPRPQPRPESRTEYRTEFHPDQQAPHPFDQTSHYRQEPKADHRPEFRPETRESYIDPHSDPRPPYRAAPMPLGPVVNGARYEAYEDVRISPPLPSAGSAPAASSNGQAPYQPQSVPYQAAHYSSPSYPATGYPPEFNPAPSAPSQSQHQQDPYLNQSRSTPANSVNGTNSAGSSNYGTPLHTASNRESAPVSELRSESRPESKPEIKSEPRPWSDGSNSATNPAPAQTATPPAPPADPNAPVSGLQRAVNAVRSALPLVQRLLPLLDGNFTTAINALVAPQSAHHPAPPVKVDLEPIERGLAEVSTSHRELRTQVLEQITTFKRVEDQLDRVREATDRNTLEQQELVEDLRSVGSRLSTFAILGLVLLLLSVAVNVFFLVQLQHILR